MPEMRQLNIFGEENAVADDRAADIMAAFNLIRSCERTLPLLLSADEFSPNEREALVRAAKKLLLSLRMVLAAAERGDQRA